MVQQQIVGSETVTKGDRTIAKSANFRVAVRGRGSAIRVYAKSEYGLDFTLDQAAGIREASFRAFPGVRDWHIRTGSQINTRKRLDTRTLGGRLRKHVMTYSEALCSPVQGTRARACSRSRWAGCTLTGITLLLPRYVLRVLRLVPGDDDS